MPNILWRIAIAAFCYVVFLYITPLFLNVLEITPAGNLWELVRALAAVGAVAYVIWGPHTYPWGHPRP
jgi:hypothetical protein